MEVRVRVKKKWYVKRDGYGFFKGVTKLEHTARFEGWFLFGFIPLYIRQVSNWTR